MLTLIKSQLQKVTYCFLKLFYSFRKNKSAHFTNFAIGSFVTLVLCSIFSFSVLAEKQETHRELQFENDKVKVWKTTIMPNQPLKMHRHEHARVVVGLKGGVLKKIEEDGRTSDLVFETAKAYWLEADPVGELHGDINESAVPIEVMVIEFKD